MRDRLTSWRQMSSVTALCPDDFFSDKLWRAMLSSFSTSREGWFHGEVVAFVSHEQDWSSLPKSQIALLPREACFDQERWQRGERKTQTVTPMKSRVKSFL